MAINDYSINIWLSNASIIDDKRSNYWKGKKASSRNFRDLWCLVKTVIGKHNTSQTAARNLPDADVCDTFCSEKGWRHKKCNSNCTTADLHHCTIRLSPFCFVSVRFNKLSKIIQAAPAKQCRLDLCPMWLLKDCTDKVMQYIASLFNASLAVGVFPDVFKSSYITPQF